jgi:adenylate cyclase
LRPEETISLLNEFIACTAGCVKKTDGSLELFSTGVAAYWGVLSSSGNDAHDALNCARCALMIRAAIYEINMERVGRGGGPERPLIKFSCGISSGEFAAGIVKDGERTAYAPVGEAARLTETAKVRNRICNADILITESTWRLIQKYVIAQEMPSLQIEGRTLPVRVFALVNLRSRPDEPQSFPATLDEVRNLYAGVTDGV